MNLDSQAQDFAIELAFLTDKYLSRGLSKEAAANVLQLLMEGFASNFSAATLKEIDAALERNIA